MYTEDLIKRIAKKSNIDISEFDIKELIMGMAVELEHGSVNDKTDVTGDDPEATFKIVIAHMHEMPDYYTKLKAMEGKKENISEYARRMRELAGLSEGNQNKSLKTINEGDSSFENGMTFYAKDMTGVVNEEEVAKAAEIVKESNKEISEVVEESVDKDEFETHKFEQRKIEEGENDQELYNLNENTIIVLDFLDEEED